MPTRQGTYAVAAAEMRFCDPPASGIVPPEVPIPRPGALRTVDELAARVGAQPELVQASGGNISLKHDGVLWVKASGTQLADALTREIMVGVDLESASIPSGRIRQVHGCLRPSIETPLHALMPHPVVLHVHSVSALAHATRRSGISRLTSRLEGVSWTHAPYSRPGAPLTDAVEEALRRAEKAVDLVVLMNHGLLLGGDDARAVWSLLERVEDRLRVPGRQRSPADLDTLQTWMSEAPKGRWRLPRYDVAHSLATDSITADVWVQGALYPDHLVFLGRGWPAVHPGESATTFEARWQREHKGVPRFAVLPGSGVVVLQDLAPAGDDMLRAAAEVGRRIDDPGDVRPLPASAEDALVNWEAERYRRELARAGMGGGSCSS